MDITNFLSFLDNEQVQQKIKQILDTTVII